MRALLLEVSKLWGWKRREDAEIWLGWVAAAALGGFPEWRTHVYVHGPRGSGKSKLIELAACLLGDLSGDVINDATEAGIRQGRNHQARPVLIDEFEPDGTSKNSTQQEAIFALFRRMSGGQGGRISRGSANHKVVHFRALGAAYVKRSFFPSVECVREGDAKEADVDSRLRRLERLFSDALRTSDMV